VISQTTDDRSRPHVFTDAYYARLAEFEERHWWSIGIRRIQGRLLRRAPSDNVRRVLDAGCGTGLTLTWVRGYSAAEPIGLDRTAVGLMFCRSRGHTRLLQGDATELPFETGGFDLVLSCDVIQHLPRPHGDWRAFSEIARVLAPGGRLLLRTNSRCGYPDDETEPNYHRYALGEIGQKLADAGLHIAALSYVNCLPALAQTAWRRMNREQLLGRDPGLHRERRLPGLLRRTLSSVLALEGVYIDYVRRPLPFGHSIIALAEKER
jgi:SAM-dependent methyltransferase